VDDFEVTRSGAVVTPRGEIDLATVDAVGAALASATAPRVVLDLRETTFLDSAGIRLIVEAARDLEAQGRELVVVRGGPEVRRVFDLVGLDGRLRILDAPPE
jgi:anti-anti-sigma factor